MFKLLSKLFLCLSIVIGGTGMNGTMSYQDMEREVRALREQANTAVMVHLSSIADLQNSTAPFAWVGGTLHANTGSPGSYVRIWPGGETQTELLPTEDGEFIEATFNPDDGSPKGNWRDVVTGKAVYFRPDTKLFYIWNEPDNIMYRIRLPGAVEWIDAVYSSIENAFRAFDAVGGVYPMITWDAANGWYTVEGGTVWMNPDFESLPTTFDPPVIMRVNLNPVQKQQGALHVSYYRNHGSGFSGSSLDISYEELFGKPVLSVTNTNVSSDGMGEVIEYAYAWEEIYDQEKIMLRKGWSMTAHSAMLGEYPMQVEAPFVGITATELTGSGAFISGPGTIVVAEVA